MQEIILTGKEAFKRFIYQTKMHIKTTNFCLQPCSMFLHTLRLYFLLPFEHLEYACEHKTICPVQIYAHR